MRTTRLTCAEITLERAVHVLDRAALDEKPREMSTADHVRIRRELAHAFLAAGNACIVKRRGDFVGPAVTAIACCGQSRLQLHIGRIDAEPDHVQCVPVPGHRDFDPIDQGEIDALRGGTGRSEAPGVIVIGQREHFEAAFARARHEFVRG